MEELKTVTKSDWVKRSKDLSKLTIPNLIAFIVAACGGGGGGSSASPVVPPPSNSAPQAGADLTVTLSEDISSGSLNLSAPTDSDGDALTISITAIPTSGLLKKTDGTVLANGDALTTSELQALTFTPDANANDSTTSFGSFSYSVSDGSATDSRTVTIAVDAVNDAPTYTGITEFGPTENTTAITTLEATDIDGDTLTYSIGGGLDQELFTIDSSTGELSFITPPDYENPADSDQDNIYQVDVNVADPSDAVITIGYVITVNNVSEPETVTGTVVDGLVSGATVKLLDADGNVLATTTTDANGQYTLEATESIGTRIVVDGGTDTYTNEGITITLSATKSSKYVSAISTILDKAGSEASAVQINLGLPNNFDPASDNPLETLAAQKINAQLINIIAVGESLLEGAGLTDNTGDELIVNQITNALINGDNLSDETVVKNILTKSSENTVAADKTAELAPAVASTLIAANEVIAESNDVIQIATVQKVVLDDDAGVVAAVKLASSDDTVNYSATTKSEIETQSLTAEIVNQAPLNINLSAQSFSENSTGVTVGEVSATDPDSRETFTFELSGTDKDFFELSGTTLKLKDSVSANFEDKASYTITLTATDSGNISLSKDFSITVTDVNETPTAIALSANAFAENSAGTSIGTLSTTDPDTGDTFTYELSGTDADSFELSGTTLKLKDATAADYETKSSYTVTVKVTDSGNNTKAQDLTINVTNVNEAPTAVGLSANSIAENSAGITIGSLSTTDPDTGDTFTYELSGSDKDLFELSGNSLKLKDTVSADFESKASYSLTVTASDSGGLSFEQPFTIEITDANDAPTAIALSANAIAENSAGITIGTLSTTDPDSDSFTYELSGTDADSFELADSTLKLKDSVSADFENKASYSLTVTASDSGGLSFEQPFTIEITDVNEAPTAVGLSANAIAENSAGITIGTLSTTDQDANDTSTYELSGTDADSFELSDSTLKLKDSVSADFEDKASYEITITATDSENLSVDQNLTLQVTDVNEAPTAVALSANTIAENSAGITIGTLSTTDPDTGDTFTYELSGTDADSFELSDSTLKLKDSVSADFESKASYSLTVTASDSGELSFEQPFTIEITDVNEAPTAVALSANAMAENSAGITIGTLSTTDQDANDTFTYELSGTDADSFELEDSTLKLKDSVSADFESKASYEITVTATDSANNTKAQELTVNVTNVNETPTGVLLSSSSFDENSAGQSVGTLSATDPDTGDSFTYELSGTDADSFELSESTLKLKDTVSADFESKASYEITITATDSENLSVDQNLTLQVTDVNEAPTAVALSANSIAENLAGTTIGTLSTTDQDANDTFTYELSGTDADSFELSGTTLKLKDTVSADFENKASYSLTVTASDSEELSFEQSFTIEITDANDAPTAVNLTNLEIEQSVSGVSVDALTVSDEDAGDTFTFELSGTDADSFEIVDSALKLKDSVSADWLTKPSYSFTIKVTDSGGGSFEQAITVKVIEPPFAPEFKSASRVTMLEDSKKILTVEATDLNGDTLTYSLAGGLDEALFNIDQNTGELSFASAPDYENPGDSNSDGVYEVTVRSSDGALNTDQSMIITVIKTFIEGTLQKDSITGTSSNDYIKTNGGDDLIDGGDGNDRLIMTGPASSYQFYEKYGITILWGGAGSTNGETLVTLVNVEEVELDDLLWNPTTSSYNYKFGSLGVNDTLLGSNDADIFDPAGGWDRMVGYEGEDVVVIWGYSEDFEVYTKYGITKVIGLSGAPAEYAGKAMTLLGVEKISFFDEDIDVDVTEYGALTYTYDNELIIGGDSQDVWDIAGGDDIVDGNGGDDYVLIFAKSSDFTYTTLYGVTKLYGNGNSLIYGWDVITLVEVEYVEFVLDDFTWQPSAENYNVELGYMGPEIFTGTDSQNVYDPGGGADIIDGKGGNDYVILFDDKADFEIVSMYGVTKIWGKDTSKFFYKGQVITLQNVEAAKFKDQLIGLPTSSDYDVTFGGYGDDNLTGTSGDDYFDGIGGNDFINGGAGNDHLIIFASSDDFTYVTQGTIAKLFGGPDAGIYSGTTITLKNTEYVEFYDLSWTVPYEASEGNVITGSSSSEKLTGTTGDDYFDPVSGDDYIIGNGGTDTVWIFSDISNFWYLEVDGIVKLGGKSTAGPYSYNMMTLIDVDVVDFLDEPWDVPQATSSKNIILGSRTSESITGTAGDDVIDTAGGDDFVDGGAGDDHVVIWKDFYTYDADDNKTGTKFYLEELAGIVKIWGLTGSGDYAGDVITLTNVEKITFRYSETESYNTVDTNDKNFVLGTAGNDYLLGTAENDYIDSAGSSDLIIGDAGVDTALFFLPSSYFNIQTIAGVTRISAKENSFEYEGSTTYLFEIEKIMFSDETIEIDTSIPSGLILGSPAANLLEGSSGNDIFDPWYGSDLIKGNGGTDSVIIFGARQYFEISTDSLGVTHLKGLPGSGGYYGAQMELNEISKIIFSDQEVSLLSYQIILDIDNTYLDEGETTTLSIRLSAAPTSDVVITVAGGRFLISETVNSGNQVTFTSSNWNNAQEFDITAVNDNSVNATGSSNLSFTVATDDSNYADKTPSDIALNILDDESPLHSISGSIWDDANEDGIKDSDEAYLENWTVFLDLNQNRLRDSTEPTTQTDATGKYVFTDLEAGTYFVGVDLPLGWGQTKPASASTKAVSVGLSEETGTQGTSHVNNDSTYHSAYQQLIGLKEFQQNATFGKYDGSGSAIVIIDSGADLDHPHFGPDSDGDGVSDRIVFQYDFYYDDNNAQDYSGHGTHVAGTAAGSDQQFPGVASGADIIILKVFPDEKGGGAKNIEAALQWVVENAEKYNIVAVNLSLGVDTYDTEYRENYASELFESLANMGVIVIASSGNAYVNRYDSSVEATNRWGQDWDSLGVGYPSSDEWAFSIGASEHSDTGLLWGLFSTEEDVIAPFSNRDDELTSIFAPGVEIVAADYRGGVTTKNGTSMASPIVAGAVVVIQQIAEALFGQRLTFTEILTLFQTYGDTIIDGDDENDGLYHSGDSYARLNILEIAKALISLAGPGQYSTTLSSGNDATGLDFGVTELESGTPGETGILVGTYFSDRLDGSSSADKIYGGSGNDEIYGKAGADFIYGGDGNDTIEGGAGIDTLTGGNGKDRFKYLSLDELGDVITDFSGGANGDVIDVKTLLSSLGYDESDPFVEGWLKIEQDGNDTLIKLDKDGGGDNFDTLVVRLQDFTLEDFKRENIDPESTIWTSSSTPSSSIVGNNTSISSLDSSDDALWTEMPTGVNITDDGLDFSNIESLLTTDENKSLDFNLADLLVLEEGDAGLISLPDEIPEIIIEEEQEPQNLNSFDEINEIWVDFPYEEEEMLVVSYEI